MSAVLLVFKCHYSVIKINVTGSVNDNDWLPEVFSVSSHLLKTGKSFTGTYLKKGFD